MNIYRTLAVATLVIMTGCTQLSDEDRATLNTAKTTAQEAKLQSAQAITIAQQAEQSAAQSALSAQASSDKSDRIFRRSGVK